MNFAVDKEGKVILLGKGRKGDTVGKRVEGICNRVMENVGECILYWLCRW